jgi:hypothetical protein
MPVQKINSEQAQTLLYQWFYRFENCSARRKMSKYLSNQVLVSQLLRQVLSREEAINGAAVLAVMTGRCPATSMVPVP